MHSRRCWKVRYAHLVARLITAGNCKAPKGYRPVLIGFGARSACLPGLAVRPFRSLGSSRGTVPKGNPPICTWVVQHGCRTAGDGRDGIPLYSSPLATDAYASVWRTLAPRLVPPDRKST